MADNWFNQVMPGMPIWLSGNQGYMQYGNPIYAAQQHWTSNSLGGIPADSFIKCFRQVHERDRVSSYCFESAVRDLKEELTREIEID